ncbi:MAG: RluA family pseudouridine synthase [Anaerovoracaceae bacterium]|jgi:23S rRNA pseudouridine955/2504/2580 synthase
MVELSVGGNDAGQRLDRFLKKYLRNASLSHIYKMIRKDIKLNGRRAKNDVMLREGDVLRIYVSEEELDELTRAKKVPAAKKQFRIAYEDSDIIIVEKPFGLLTHGDRTEKKNTLQNQVRSYLSSMHEYSDDERTFVPSPVNRLDRNTTGLVIFGKNAEALRVYSRLIRERGGVRKFYLTVTAGVITGEMKLEGVLSKDERTNTVSERGGEGSKQAVTIVRPLETSGGYTLAEAELVTGRTHQIRAQLAGAGYPIIGDAKYGSSDVNRVVKKKYGLTTQLLHAYKLQFTGGPVGGRTVISALPKKFRKIAEDIFGEIPELS